MVQSIGPCWSAWGHLDAAQVLQNTVSFPAGLKSLAGLPCSASVGHDTWQGLPKLPSLGSAGHALHAVTSPTQSASRSPPVRAACSGPLTVHPSAGYTLSWLTSMPVTTPVCLVQVRPPQLETLAGLPGT